MVVAGKNFSNLPFRRELQKAQLACQSGFILQAVGKPDVFTGITRAAGKPMGCDLA